MPKGRSTDDVNWLAYIRDAAETWIFVTGDRRLRANPAEVAALRSARRHGFLLASRAQLTCRSSPSDRFTADLVRIRDGIAAAR